MVGASLAGAVWVDEALWVMGLSAQPGSGSVPQTLSRVLQLEKRLGAVLSAQVRGC